MKNNFFDVIQLIIDIISKLIVPFVIPIVTPTIIALISRKETKKIVNSRLDHLEKQVREHIRGYSDEEQEFIDKKLNEIFSKPSMRWYR